VRDQEDEDCPEDQSQHRTPALDAPTNIRPIPCIHLSFFIPESSMRLPGSQSERHRLGGTPQRSAR
jgi:hypothetical protein